MRFCLPFSGRDQAPSVGQLPKARVGSDTGHKRFGIPKDRRNVSTQAVIIIKIIALSTI